MRFGGLSMLHKHSKCSFLNWSGLILTRKPHKCTLNMILVPQLKKDALWSSGRASTGMFMGIFRMYLTVWQQLLGLNLSLQLSDRCRQIKWLIIRPSCPWLFPRTAAVSCPVRAGVDETELTNLVQHGTKADVRQWRKQGLMGNLFVALCLFFFAAFSIY